MIPTYKVEFLHTDKNLSSIFDIICYIKVFSLLNLLLISGRGTFYFIDIPVVILSVSVNPGLWAGNGGTLLCKTE